MKLKCIIIEDEPLAQEKLSGFIGQVPMLGLEAIFDNAVEAIGYINDNNIDLVFLDIEMPKLNGIQFIESLSNRPFIVIVSAYDKYALKGYDYNVSDYLLKPYSFNRFMQSVNRVLSQFSKAGSVSIAHVEEEVMFVKTGQRIEKIDLKDILFIQGMKDYQMIATESSKIMTLQTFKDILNVLSEPNFVRIHKSYIVALRKIKNIEKNRIRIGDELLPISDTFKDHFYELLRKNKHLM